MCLIPSTLTLTIVVGYTISSPRFGAPVRSESMSLGSGPGSLLGLGFGFGFGFWLPYSLDRFQDRHPPSGNVVSQVSLIGLYSSLSVSHVGQFLKELYRPIGSLLDLTSVPPPTEPQQRLTGVLVLRHKLLCSRLVALCSRPVALFGHLCWLLPFPQVPYVDGLSLLIEKKI